MHLVRAEKSGGVAVIGLAEPAVLDAANVDELREHVGEIEAEHSRIVFDMSQVQFVDSSVIGALVGTMRTARDAGGDVKLARIPPDIAAIFELTRLDQVFSIHPSVDEAVQDFGGLSSLQGE